MRLKTTLSCLFLDVKPAKVTAWSCGEGESWELHPTLPQFVVVLSFAHFVIIPGFSRLNNVMIASYYVL